MKFDVEVEDYGDENNNAIYNNVDVRYHGEDIRIATSNGIKKYEHARVYCISTDDRNYPLTTYIKFYCMIPTSNIATYNAGEITLRIPKESIAEEMETRESVLAGVMYRREQEGYV